MSALQIEVSPSTSFTLEGEFGNVSFNGLEHALAAQGRTDISDQAVLSYPVHRLNVLGQGSSSVVYKSVMLNKLRVTAEKVFLVGNSKKQLQLFRELQSLKSVCSAQSEEDGSEHSASPYIVELLEVFSNPTDGTLSLCLEYMNCGSLENVVQSGGCRDERILSSIAFQMTSGLNFLHERRMIHRDVKPSNALISHDGRVKLADFGLARTLDHGQSLANSFVGTFLYMALERLTGESYSFQSDIWSLGLTIHAVALGQFPYLGKKGYWEVLNATQQGAPAIDLSYSQPLQVFLHQCYQPRARDRPSAAALLGDVFLSAAETVIPAELRHQVCRVLPDIHGAAETVAPSVGAVPVLETQLAAAPQSAPCSGTGNLTYRPSLESKSARKAPSGTKQQKASTALSGTARTALMLQHQHRHVTVKTPAGASHASRYAKNSTVTASISEAQRHQTHSNKAHTTTTQTRTAAVGLRGATAGTARTDTSTATAGKGKAPPKLVHSASDRNTVTILVPTGGTGGGTKVRSVSARPAKGSDTMATPKQAPGKNAATRYSESGRNPTRHSAVEVAVPAVSHALASETPRSNTTDASNREEAIEPDLVRAWEKYVVLAREHQLREDSKARTSKRTVEPPLTPVSNGLTATTTTPPPGEREAEKERECYDYTASPSVAVNSLRRLIAKQHDSREMFVTEQIVQRLAAAIPCDAAALREEFCSALERINRVWQGRAVQRLPGAVVAGKGSGEKSPPVRTTGIAALPTDRPVPRGYQSELPVEESKAVGEGGRCPVMPVAVLSAESLEVDEELSVNGLPRGASGDCDRSLDESIEEDLDLLRLHLGLGSDQHQTAARSTHQGSKTVCCSKPTRGSESVGGSGAEAKAGLQLGGDGGHSDSDGEGYADESFEIDEEE